MKPSADPANYPLLVLLGPTASGKSALAMVLAGRFHGEIVNYDSIQVFKYFSLGSAKPSPSDRERIAHHLIDILEPEELFTAGEYARRARSVLLQIQERGHLPILVGGTGLYLRALLEGLFEGPQRNEALRNRLRLQARGRGVVYLHRLLNRFDPAAANRIAPQDSHRLIRALEIYLSGRKTQSEFFRQPRISLKGFSPIKIGLNPPRKELYTRINRRVEEMFRLGLVSEAKGILDRGVTSAAKPFQSLGYKQAVQLIQGQGTERQAVEETQRATRQYAKRQMTWFRKEDGVKWFAGFGDELDIQQGIFNFLEFECGLQELVGGGRRG